MKPEKIAEIAHGVVCEVIPLVSWADLKDVDKTIFTSVVLKVNECRRVVDIEDKPRADCHSRIFCVAALVLIQEAGCDIEIAVPAEELVDGAEHLPSPEVSTVETHVEESPVAETPATPPEEIHEAGENV